MRLRLGESILREHSESAFTEIGNTIDVRVDLMICDDLATSRSIDLFSQMGGKVPVNKDSIIITCEHFTPPSTLDSAKIQNDIRNTAKRWNLKHFQELGQSGIGPVVAFTDRLIRPGMLIVGTDPIVGALGGVGCFATAIGAGDMAALWKTGKIHLIIPRTFHVVLNGKKHDCIDGIDIALKALSATIDQDEYHAFEFEGDCTADLNIDDRMSISYFMMESGSSSAIIPPSKEIFSFLNLPVTDTSSSYPETDFSSDLTIDLTDLKPLVAPPPDMRNIVNVQDVGDVKLDMIIIGGGMGGTLHNLREFDRIIRGKKLHPGLRVIVYPASSHTLHSAHKDGTIGRFIDQGIFIGSPGRGAEGFGNHGLLTKNEVVLINGSNNFAGILGHQDSKIYLAGTKSCAASALTGKITSCMEVM